VEKYDKSVRYGFKLSSRTIITKPTKLPVVVKASVLFVNRIFTHYQTFLGSITSVLELLHVCFVYNYQIDIMFVETLSLRRIPISEKMPHRNLILKHYCIS
jgi:hypothetical protein